jgi:hypothetical protein
MGDDWTRKSADLRVFDQIRRQAAILAPDFPG